ncbi:MAG: iron-containing alcohol dehydrogenase [Desulfarculaceae bacterium]|nr:iron-containing alcohol dehydrogenase [Desulfarculaceae bacterium]
MNPLQIYNHLNPGQLLFGKGSLGQMDDFLPSRAKTLVVTDQGLRAAGLVEKATDQLERLGVEYVVYDQVSQDAPLDQIMQAAELYRSEGCGAIMAIGGGSPMDAAKGVGVDVSQPGSVREYATGRVIEAPLPPFTAIPTTAGTGSEVTYSAVISDNQTTRKIVIRNQALVPKLAVLDPDLLAGLPPRIAAETGADAMSHAMEGLVTRNAQPVSDALELHAIKLIGQNLRAMVGDPGNPEAAANMLLASTLASMGWTNVGLGLTHSLAHPLGAHYHISHGAACALYLPYVMHFNILAAAPKYRMAAEALGQDVNGLSDHDAAMAALEAVQDLFDDVGLAMSYEEMGIEDFQIHEDVLEEILSVPTKQANPRVSGPEEIVGLLEAPK